jgi:hypothetical protein
MIFPDPVAFASKVGSTLVRLCRLMCGGGYAPPTAAKLVPGYAPSFGISPESLPHMACNGDREVCQGTGFTFHPSYFILHPFNVSTTFLIAF